MLHNSEKDFIKRHIGPSKKDEKDMLGQLGYQNINELISQTVPEKILFKGELNIGEPNSEYEALRILKGLSRKNQIYSQRIQTFLKKSHFNIKLYLLIVYLLMKLSF